MTKIEWISPGRQGQTGQHPYGDWGSAEQDRYANQSVEDPLIERLIATTKKRQGGLGGGGLNPGLRQRRPARAQMNHPGGQASFLFTQTMQAAQAGAQGLSQHDHPGTAAEWAVVNPSIGVVSMIPRVVAAQPPKTSFEGPAGHAVARCAQHHLWEQGDDLEVHPQRLQSACQSTTMRRSGQETSTR